MKNIYLSSSFKTVLLAGVVLVLFTFLALVLKGQAQVIKTVPEVGPSVITGPAVTNNNLGNNGLDLGKNSLGNTSSLSLSLTPLPRFNVKKKLKKLRLVRTAHAQPVLVVTPVPHEHLEAHGHVPEQETPVSHR